VKLQPKLKILNPGVFRKERGKESVTNIRKRKGNSEEKGRKIKGMPANNIFTNHTIY